MVFVANNRSLEVFYPGKQALYFPSMPTAPEFPAILGFWLFASFAMRCNHFNTTFVKQLIVKFIPVVSPIANQLIGRILSKAAVYSGLNKLYLMGESLST